MITISTIIVYTVAQQLYLNFICPILRFTVLNYSIYGTYNCMNCDQKYTVLFIFLWRFGGGNPPPPPACRPNSHPSQTRISLYDIAHVWPREGRFSWVFTMQYSNPPPPYSVWRAGGEVSLRIFCAWPSLDSMRWGWGWGVWDWGWEWWGMVVGERQQRN